MTRKKNKSPIKLFIGVFAVIVAVMVLSTLLREKVVLLLVPDNAGVTVLETVDSSLFCVFQDGQVVSWDWGMVPQQKGDFKAVSDRAILLDTQHLAAVSTTGKKVLTVYSLPDGQKQKDISVGWEDQDVWLRISPDKKTVALVRCNAVDANGSILYEFQTIDMDTERTGLPVPVSIRSDTGDFVDTAVDNNGVHYAVGSKDNAGRIAAVDLEKGSVLWDAVFEGTKEFCSVAVSPVGDFVYAGNRDGFLYKLGTDTGEIQKKIQLLEDGETRSVTNDYSVLNAAFNGDGQYFVATITPRAYLLRADTDTVIHRCSPTSNLTSKITFSPDNRFFATSDIRASKPIKVWPMPDSGQ